MDTSFEVKLHPRCLLTTTICSHHICQLFNPIPFFCTSFSPLQTAWGYLGTVECKVSLLWCMRAFCSSWAPQEMCHSLSIIAFYFNCIFPATWTTWMSGSGLLWISLGDNGDVFMLTDLMIYSGCGSLFRVRSLFFSHSGMMLKGCRFCYLSWHFFLGFESLLIFEHLEQDDERPRKCIQPCCSFIRSDIAFSTFKGVSRASKQGGARYWIRINVFVVNQDPDYKLKGCQHQQPGSWSSPYLCQAIVVDGLFDLYDMTDLVKIIVHPSDGRGQSERHVLLWDSLESRILPLFQLERLTIDSKTIGHNGTSWDIAAASVIFWFWYPQLVEDDVDPIEWVQFDRASMAFLLTLFRVYFL